MGSVILKPTLVTEQLSRAKVLRYTRMKNMAEEKAALEARVRALDKEQKMISAELIEVFEDKGVDVLRLPGRKLLRRNLIKVEAAVIDRAAYEYTKWEEVQG